MGQARINFNSSGEIEILPIDDIVKDMNLSHVDLIKLDIEGTEEKALLGAEETIRK